MIDLIVVLEDFASWSFSNSIWGKDITLHAFIAKYNLMAVFTHTMPYLIPR